MLDIGGDIGALVARMDAARAGTELYLRPEHDPATTVHTGVWRRVEVGVALTVAVFPELRAGTYRVLDDNGVTEHAVEVRGGEVAMIDLRTRTSAPAID